MYTDVPTIANKVKLKGVFSKSDQGWLTSELDMLHSLVVDQKVLVILRSKQVPGLPALATVILGQTCVNKYMLMNSKGLQSTKKGKKAVAAWREDDADVIIESEHGVPVLTGDEDVIIGEWVGTFAGIKDRSLFYKCLNQHCCRFFCSVVNVIETKSISKSTINTLKNDLPIYKILQICTFGKVFFSFEKNGEAYIVY